MNLADDLYALARHRQTGILSEDANEDRQIDVSGRVVRRES
jgi:hypothetical protein